MARYIETVTSEKIIQGDGVLWFLLDSASSRHLPDLLPIVARRSVASHLPGIMQGGFIVVYVRAFIPERRRIY
jgi:hypothetical protein